MKEHRSIYLSKEQYTEEFNFLFYLLKQDGIESVPVLFGFAWGNEYGNWSPIEIQPDDIWKKIEEAEDITGAEFFEHDLFINASNGEYEILFCHEHDIHIKYNKMIPIIDDLLKRWNELKLLRDK